MMYLSISRNWLFSSTARRVYFVCALLDIAFIATRVGTSAAMAVAGAVTLPANTRMVLTVLFIPEIVGSAILFVGMSYCWLGFGGSCSKTLLWVVFLRLFLITAPIYYFAVYRSMVSRKLAELQASVSVN